MADDGNTRREAWVRRSRDRRIWMAPVYMTVFGIWPVGILAVQEGVVAGLGLAVGLFAAGVTGWSMLRRDLINAGVPVDDILAQRRRKEPRVKDGRTRARPCPSQRKP